jgi:hypothetical protein
MLNVHPRTQALNLAPERGGHRIETSSTVFHEIPPSWLRKIPRYGYPSWNGKTLHDRAYLELKKAIHVPARIRPGATNHHSAPWQRRSGRVRCRVREASAGGWVAERALLMLPHTVRSVTLPLMTRRAVRRTNLSYSAWPWRASSPRRPPA